MLLPICVTNSLLGAALLGAMRIAQFRGGGDCPLSGH